MFHLYLYIITVSQARLGLVFASKAFYTLTRFSITSMRDTNKCTRYKAINEVVTINKDFLIEQFFRLSLNLLLDVQI